MTEKNLIIVKSKVTMIIEDIDTMLAYLDVMDRK